jgi:hypothetical protein
LAQVILREQSNYKCQSYNKAQHQYVFIEAEQNHQQERRLLGSFSPLKSNSTEIALRGVLTGISSGARLEPYTADAHNHCERKHSHLAECTYVSGLSFQYKTYLALCILGLLILFGGDQAWLMGGCILLGEQVFKKAKLSFQHRVFSVQRCVVQPEPVVFFLQSFQFLTQNFSFRLLFLTASEGRLSIFNLSQFSSRITRAVYA